MSLNRLRSFPSRVLKSVDRAALAVIATGAGLLAAPAPYQSDSLQSPQAMATAIRTSGVAPFAVTFDAIGSSTAVVQPPANTSPNAYAYRWEFGDPTAGW